MKSIARTANLEDYWERMALAKQKLFDFAVTSHANNRDITLCLRKAQQLSDRYHERFNPTLYRLEK